MRRLLVTGFGPFPRTPRNPSAEIARRVAALPAWRRRGVVAKALVMPTRYAAIEAALLPAIRDFRPDAVLMLGVAPRRARVTPEIGAVNRASRLFPDAGGTIAARRLAIEPGARLRRRTTAPVAAMARRLRSRGAPAATSRDAGRYLCNAAYFAALGASLQAPRFACAFIHVPSPDRTPSRKAIFGVRTMTPLIEDCAVILLNSRESMQKNRECR